MNLVEYIGNIYFCFTLQTVAEWERRRENFVKEIDFVIADVVCFFLSVCSFTCSVGANQI